MKAPNLHPMDEVALQKDLPESDLHYGDIGVIIRSFQGGTYDVEFENNQGKSVIVTKVLLEDLLLVRH